MRKLITCLVALCLPAVALAGGHGDAEAEVRAASEAFNEAYLTNDVDRYMSYYADDAVVWWYGERQDLAAYHAEWQAMIESGGGVEKNDSSDEIYQVLADGKVVVASFFVHNVTRSPDGEKTEAKAYESEVWTRVDGEWKVVSLHFSEF